MSRLPRRRVVLGGYAVTFGAKKKDFWMAIFLMVGGLVFLVAGAEFLVRGASQLARALGIPPVIIGLTVVAFGTSAPEFAVGIGSTLQGQPGIAVGNAVGSNILNVLLILGSASIIAPLFVARQLIRLDIPVMIAISIIVYMLALDGSISRAEGFCLTSGLVVYTGILVRMGTNSAKAEKRSGEKPKKTFTMIYYVSSIVFFLLGLAMLVLGSKGLVSGATSIAQHLGVSDSVIGLTIVAGGTSLPELVTTVVAAFRNQRDMAVGNVVGSNLFNLLGALGLAALVGPTGLPIDSSVLYFDFPIMLAAALVCLPICFTGAEISRWEGGFLFAMYVTYTTYLILAANEHQATEFFSNTVLYFVAPIAVVVFLAIAWNSIRKKRD